MKKEIKEFIDKDVVNVKNGEWSQEELEILMYCKSKGYPPKMMFNNRDSLGLSGRSYGSIDSKYHKVGV